MKEEFKMSPVGFVKNADGEQKLVINSEYRAALDGLEDFSHIIVLWWCNLFDSAEHRQVLSAEQPYKGSPESLGIFATRAPLRPNPVAITTAGLIRLDKNTGEIHLDYIDAEDGTPVVDIKPYYPCSDRVKEATVPAFSAGWPQWYEESADFDWASVFRAC